MSLDLILAFKKMRTKRSTKTRTEELFGHHLFPVMWPEPHEIMRKKK